MTTDFKDMSAKYPSLSDEILIDAGNSVLRLSKKFTKSQIKERWIQGVVLGYLEAKIGKMEMEFRDGKNRIDFRKGGPHPSLIELVTILKGHAHDYYPYRNITELEKLCKFAYSKARKRVLLMIDMHYNEPLDRKVLKDKYLKSWNKIRKKPNSVTILYIHPIAYYRVVLEKQPR